MKKIKYLGVKAFFVVTMATALVACNEGAKDGLSSDRERDSLRNIIDQKDNEINDLMGTFNEIQQGFDLINEAEGRVNMLKENAENNSSRENIRENMEFIQETMEENRRKIEELENKLNASTINSSKLKETISNLTRQLNEKSAELDSLRTQLAEKDVMIAELGSTVNTLKDENAQVKQQKEEVEQIAQSQDAQLNTAWYVFGTSKELKEQGILKQGGLLKKGEVLQGNYNKNYFTKIDIRKVNVISLESSSAEILTTHPAGSYTLLKDSKGEYTLRITDAAKFWSVSKYLVVKVK
jgi:myosin heavy subunit